MKYKSIYSFAVVFALLGMFSITAFHHTGKSSAQVVTPLSNEQDNISGDWDALLEAFDTQTAVKINLKLDGEKITGNAESAHTGTGTISNGWWKNDRLSFTVNFSKHESISFKGELKKGKLVGEYTTEGRISKWEALRKDERGTKDNKTTAAPNAMNSDAISGEWNTSLIAQDTTAPLTLNLKLNGDKITGTSASSHMGAGTVENGSWKDNKISFSLKIANTAITFNGVLKDGKLDGEFSAGKMTGKWEAVKK